MAEPVGQGERGELEGLDGLGGWMVDYEGEEGGPVETQLSWITGPNSDPTTRRPDVGDYLVRLADVRLLPALKQHHILALLGAIRPGVDDGDLPEALDLLRAALSDLEGRDGG